MHSQRMASIAPIIIGCIDYLAYGTIFTRAMFLPRKKFDVFFSTRKAVDERWEVVSGLRWYVTNMNKYGRCGTKYHILPTEHI